MVTWIGSSAVDGALLREAGAGFIGVDGAVLDSVDEDEVGEAVDAGLGLLVACVPLEAQPFNNADVAFRPRAA